MFRKDANFGISTLFLQFSSPSWAAIKISMLRYKQKLQAYGIPPSSICLFNLLVDWCVMKCLESGREINQSIHFQRAQIFVYSLNLLFANAHPWNGFVFKFLTSEEDLAIFSGFSSLKIFFGKGNQFSGINLKWRLIYLISLTALFYGVLIPVLIWI